MMASLLFIKSLYLLPLLFFSVTNAFFKELPFLDAFGGGIQQGLNPGGDGTSAGNKDNETLKQVGYASGGFQGKWELVSKSSKVSAMHLILMPPTNKAIMFDATVFGPSQMPLPPNNCRPVPDKLTEKDCFSHAVEYDTDTADLRALKILTNPWCSSGGHAVDGTIVNTGGWKDGIQSIRWLSNCPTCDWRDHANALADPRWYGTQQILADGRFIIFGGRRAFSYEYLAKEKDKVAKIYPLKFLIETTDDSENNLYPFVSLSTDNNIFLFANNRSILINTKTNTIVRELPGLPGGSRNYPASGMSTLLPLRLSEQNEDGGVPAEVIVCGGAKPEAFKNAEKEIYLDALISCGRLEITNPNAKWEMEDMPFPRVMGDMLILPNGQLLMLNGAQKGASGWGFAEDPAFTPVIYTPDGLPGTRFRELTPTKIARMYHSSSAVLPDGKILVAGSNTNNGYLFTNVKYPTELRVEKFSPPYLAASLEPTRPKIVEELAPKKLQYGKQFDVTFEVGFPLPLTDEVEVTMYYPPFTTHGYSMSQRMLILNTMEFSPLGFGQHRITVVSPENSVLAPPGYYMIFVVNSGVPSPGIWVHIQ